MLLTIYAGFLLLSLVVIVVGVTLQEGYFTFAGLFFLFLLGFVLLTDTVEYKSGYNETLCNTEEIYKYGNNFTGYHWDYDAGTAPDGPQTDAYLFHKYTNYSTDCVITYTDIYTPITSGYRTTAWWFGFLICLTSGFGAFALLWNARAAWKQKREAEK